MRVHNFFAFHCFIYFIIDISMAPTTTNQWTVTGKDGFDSLKFEKDVQIPKLGEHDVLLEIDAVSLNYRDLIIPQVGYSALK